MAREKFTFFWQGPFSQWHASTFSVNGRRFSHAEQFMMYCKAVLFHDSESAEKILQSHTPQQQKALGRQIRGFNEAVWGLFREGIVSTGSYAKFTQDPELLELLLATRGTTLVEASPHDRVWGIGLAENDPRAEDRSRWRGLNLLGEILTRTREAIAWEMSQGRKPKKALI
ncbi:MAG: NADAR family protein [Gemmataceae bacterium]